MANPFTLMYGIKPGSTVNRYKEENEVLESFQSDDFIYMYFISGIRGCGKTVLLRNISEKLSFDNNWVTIDLNPRGDLISSFANKLKDECDKFNFLKGVSISISLYGITLTKENGDTITDPEIIVTHLLENLYKKNKKILLTIDEVNNTENFKKFINFYQSLIGNKHIVYLLMTGLKENINSIMNDSASTFLTRAPKIELMPLEIPVVSLEYKKALNVDEETSVKLAKLTKGYAFAYQVLGYMFYNKNLKTINDDLIDDYHQYLWKNGYVKFWEDLTGVEKSFLIALSKAKSGSKEEILRNSNFSPTNYSQYRRRLLEKEIIFDPKYDKLEFSLPDFENFVNYIVQFD